MTDKPITAQDVARLEAHLERHEADERAKEAQQQKAAGFLLASISGLRSNGTATNAEAVSFFLEELSRAGLAIVPIAETERLRKVIDLHEAYLAGIDMARLDDFRKLAASYAPEPAPCPSQPAPTET